MIASNHSVSHCANKETSQRVAEFKGDLYAHAIKNVSQQENYTTENGLHYLAIDGIKIQVAKAGLLHSLAGNWHKNAEAIARFGEVANASIEVPGDFGAWHYRLAAVNFGSPSVVLISLKDKGGREEIRDVQILKAVASKSGQPSLLGLIPQKESANTITVAHLKQAWEEVFVPGLLKHRPELKQQLLASVSKQEALNSPVRPYGEGEGVAADGTSVVAGERLVLGGAYPYGGRTMPLGGAPDSPAMQKGLVKLSTFDLVSIYKDLSGGHVPKVVTKGMRDALGRYW